MAHLNTGAWWAEQQELMAAIGAEHTAGHISSERCVSLWGTVAEGAYRAAVEHLMDEGVIPRNEALVKPRGT